jgi:hypothetical protein
VADQFYGADRCVHGVEEQEMVDHHQPLRIEMQHHALQEACTTAATVPVAEQLALRFGHGFTNMSLEKKTVDLKKVANYQAVDMEQAS